MASLPEPQFEEEKDKFEAANLQALAALEAIDSKVVDLDVAENIKLITIGTRDKIMAKLPNHGLLFQHALAKERRNGGGEGAFRRAFESVYGKFLLEQKNETLEDPQGELIGVLKKVLKFRIGDTGIRGRTELQAAAARLHILSSYGPARDDIQKRLTESESDHTGKEQEANRLRLAVQALTNASGTLNQAADVDALLAEASEFQELKGNAQSRFNFLQADKEQDLNREQRDAFDNLEPYVDRLNNVSGLLNELCNLLEVEFGLPEEKVKVVDQFVDDFDALIEDPDLSEAKIKEFLKTKYKAFLKAIKSRSFLKGTKNSDTRKVWGDNIFKDAVKSLDDSYRYFVGNLDKVESYEEVLEMDDAIRSQRTEMKDLESKNQTFFERKINRVFDKMESVKSLRTPLLKTLVPGIRKNVDEFLRKLKAFKGEPISGMTYEELSQFVQTEFRPFVSTVLESINDVLRQKSGELGTSEGELASLAYDIQRFQGYDASVIEANIAKDIENQEAKLTEAKKEEGEIQVVVDTYDYLSGKVDSAKSGVSDLESRLSKAEKENPFNTDEIFTALNAFSDSVVEMSDASNADDDLKALCEAYLSKHSTLKSSHSTEAQALSDFISMTLNPFLNAFPAAVSAKKLQAVQRFGATRTEVVAHGKKLGALRTSSPFSRILENSFPGVKIEGGKITIRGFETNFKHIAKKLEAAHGYFDSPDNVPNLRENVTALENLLAGPKTADGTRSESPLARLMDEVKDAKLDPNSGIHSQLNRLRQFIESKNRDLTRAPNETQISKTLDQMQQRHKGPGTFTRKAERDAILEPYQTERNEQDDYISRLKELERMLNDILEQSKKLHEAMKALIGHLSITHQAGIKLIANGQEINVSNVIKEFNAIDIRSSNFKPEQLLGVYNQIKNFFAEDLNIGGLLDEIYKAKDEVSQNINLTDSQAAKRLIAAIVAEQNPDMSLPDQQKLASMILANDVATIQTEVSYGELAKRGSAELLDTVRQAGFRRKLIGFQYKEGDKTVQPFKGLKPGQFNDWAEIERLFKIGRLNHQNGFFVLAAMKEFAPKADGQPVPQIQAVKLEKKLKLALAEELTVDERMDEAGIDKILNKAFADQMKKAQELVKAYFQHFERNEGEWNGNKIKELNLRYARVREELRLGKINDATFGKRMAELVEEAKEGEVLDQVKFSQDSAMAGYWNSPFSQWFRDRGWDVGQYAKGKAKSVALSGVKLGAFGLWGATKLGLSATVQTALLPLRAAKYPLLLAAKPLVGVINLFRRQKWTPLPRIRDAVRNDAGRVVGYFKTKGGETIKGAGEKAVGVPKAEWGKTPYASKKYSERTKVDMGSLKEQADELKAKGDATPVEVAGSPFIDLKKYRDEIAKLDKILAQKPAEERGGAASGEARAAA